MDASLKELNSIPSVDLRPLIQTTDDQHSQKSSNSLKDSLMKANLVSPEISENWLKNPWDQSHAYAIYRERKDQIKLSMPSGGNSINLYAPSRHRLYVKYCKQCIGIMTFVTDWNSDIEKMIQKRIESKTNEELRQVIRNLNDYLIDKSEECEKLKIELDTIRSGGKYLSVWQQTEKNMYEKTDLEAKTKRFRFQQSIFILIFIGSFIMNIMKSPSWRTRIDVVLQRDVANSKKIWHGVRKNTRKNWYNFAITTKQRLKVKMRRLNL